MLKNNLFFLAQPARTLTAYRLDNHGSLAAIALYRAMHSSQPAGTRQWIVITSHWEALLSVKKCVLTMCTIILKLILRFARAQSALRVCKHTSDSYMSKCKVLCPAAQHAMSTFLSYTCTWTLLIPWTRNFVKVTTGNVISHRNIKHTELVTYKNIIRTSHNNVTLNPLYSWYGDQDLYPCSLPTNCTSQIYRILVSTECFLVINKIHHSTQCDKLFTTSSCLDANCPSCELI